MFLVIYQRSVVNFCAWLFNSFSFPASIEPCLILLLSLPFCLETLLYVYLLRDVAMWCPVTNGVGGEDSGVMNGEGNIGGVLCVSLV